MIRLFMESFSGHMWLGNDLVAITPWNSLYGSIFLRTLELIRIQRNSLELRLAKNWTRELTRTHQNSFKFIRIYQNPRRARPKRLEHSQNSRAPVSASRREGHRDFPVTAVGVGLTPNLQYIAFCKFRVAGRVDG